MQLTKSTYDKPEGCSKSQMKTAPKVSLIFRPKTVLVIFFFRSNLFNNVHTVIDAIARSLRKITVFFDSKLSFG